MDWRKTRKFEAREEKYSPGKVLDNGRVIRDAPRDKLDERARYVERAWLKKQGLGPNLKKQ
jgi:hypothetical protein